MEPVEIRISDVLNMLNEGKSREDIRLHYRLNRVQLKKVFQHERLKGKKTKKVDLGFVIIEDEPLLSSDEISVNLNNLNEAGTDPVLDTIVLEESQSTLDPFFDDLEKQMEMEEDGEIGDVVLPDWLK